MHYEELLGQIIKNVNLFIHEYKHRLRAINANVATPAGVFPPDIQPILPVNLRPIITHIINRSRISHDSALRIHHFIHIIMRQTKQYKPKGYTKTKGYTKIYGWSSTY